MKILVRVAMTLVALAAAALSYESLTNLGLLCGYGRLAWLYPLVLDLGAAASCAAWLHTRALQPLSMTWALLATSVVLNGTDHFLASTAMAPPWWLVIGVAAVPPATLGCVVHLAVGMGPGKKLAAADAPPVVERAAATEPEITNDLEPAQDAEWNELLTHARRIVDNSPQLVGRNRLARELGITPHRARLLLSEITNRSEVSA